MSDDNMLAVPLRRTEHVSLSLALKTCIEKEYNQHPDKFAKELDIIERARSDIVHIQVDERSVDTLAKYFTLLTSMVTKFPSDIRIDFVWYSTLGYASNAVNSFRSLQFERINVLYNLGALYSLLACKIPKTNHQDGLKKSYNLFQLSAGSFRYLIDNVLGDFENPIPLPLDKNTLESIVYLNLAQAQECFWLKAVNDGLKDNIIAKLANEVGDLYSISLNFCNKSSILKSEWIEHISLKKDHFNAAAQYRWSVFCLEKSKYGEEVARLKACINSCTRAIKYSKYNSSSSVLKDLKGLSTKAKTDLVRAEKDNDLIYLQEVLDEKNLPSIGKLPNSKPIIPPAIINMTLESTPFSSLLPYILYQTARAFQEKIESYTQRHIISEIDSLNSQLHSELQKLHLPGALDAVEKPLGVPDTLISYSEQIRSEGGLLRLEEAFRDITRLSKVCHDLFKKASDSLIVEETEDNALRTRFGTDRWTRPNSKIAGEKLYERLQRFEDGLKIAKDLDESAKQKVKPIASDLTVLSGGQSSLEQFLPHATVVKLSAVLEHSMSDLRDAISKCRGIENERAQFVKLLQSETNKIDLLPTIINKYNEVKQSDPQAKIDSSMFESVYTKSLGSFDKHLVWIQEQGDKQRSLIQIIQRRNKSFLDTLQTDDTYSTRQKAVQKLEQCYSKFIDIKSTFEQANTFYNGTTSQLKEFADECSKFLYLRREEGSELENSLSNRIQSLPAPTPQQPGIWDPSKEIRFN